MTQNFKNAEIINGVLNSILESVRKTGQQERSGESLKAASEVTRCGSQDGRLIGGSHISRAGFEVILAAEWVSWVGSRQNTHNNQFGDQGGTVILPGGRAGQPPRVTIS